MVDKYHEKWCFQQFATDVRIFKGQSKAFHFLSDMANNLDNSIKMLEGMRQIDIMVLQSELMKRKLYYLKTANEIGRNIGGIT